MTAENPMNQKGQLLLVEGRQSCDSGKTDFKDNTAENLLKYQIWNQ